MKRTRPIAAVVVGMIALTACGGDSGDSEADKLREELEATKAQVAELQDAATSTTREFQTAEPASPSTTAVPTTTTVTTTATSTTTAPTTTTSAAPAVGGTRSNPWPLGTTHSTGEWDVTILNFDWNADSRVAAANQFNDPPEPGQKYVLMRVRATYKGDDEGVPWIDLGFVLTGDDQRQYSENDCGAVEPEPFGDQPNVYAGGTVEGDVCFMIPTTLGSILAYAEESSLDGKPVWWATA